jgi:2-methylfumaryl-CoA hydratase
MSNRMTFSPGAQKELAPGAPVQLDRVRAPQYGRYLEAFVPGQVFVHPRGFTFQPSAMLDFARTFMQCNPLYLDAEFAKSHGFLASPASPQMVFNVVLALGVQNDSEKAVANLGYYGAQFLRPVLPGDTLRSMTRVASRHDRGGGKPGIVRVQTLGVNQRDEVVLQYERKIMVGPSPAPQSAPASTEIRQAVFPWSDDPAVDLGPLRFDAVDPSVTASNTYFEDFEPGDIIVHANGRTITDEHVALTYKVGNTHPLHFDRVYSQSLSGAMSGEPIVYGGLVFAWLEGLASRDVSENAVWELGFTEGYHTQPAVAGDTIAAVSRVLSSEPAPGPAAEALGVVTFQLVGVKGISAKVAVETHGEDLFVKENDKKDRGKAKIPAKIFEIERRLLLKRRPRRG